MTRCKIMTAASSNDSGFVMKEKGGSSVVELAHEMHRFQIGSSLVSSTSPGIHEGNDNIEFVNGGNIQDVANELPNTINASVHFQGSSGVDSHKNLELTEVGNGFAYSAATGVNVKVDIGGTGKRTHCALATGSICGSAAVHDSNIERGASHAEGRCAHRIYSPAR